MTVRLKRRARGVLAVTMLTVSVCVVALACVDAARGSLAAELPEPAREESLALPVAESPEQAGDEATDVGFEGPRVILQDGDIPEGANGAPIQRINPVFTNGLGRPAMAGSLDRDGVEDFFIWYDGSIIWLNSDHAEDGLDGAEGTLGVSDAAGFVYSPLANGIDSIWSHNGLVLSLGMTAPGFPDGSTVEGLNRPRMTPSGRAFWVSEVRSPLLEGMRRRETVSQVLYTTASPGVAEVEALLKSGDEVDGAVIAYVNGLRLDYEVSDNAEHVIQAANIVDPERGRRAVPAIYVDGELPMRRGDKTKNGAQHDYDLVAINDHGQYLVSGETDGDSNGDHFLAYNGEPVLWESAETVDALLVPQAVVRGLSIDNRGRALHAWSTQGFGTEYLFFACDVSQLDESVTLLQSSSKVDFDGDGIGDASVLKFNGGNGPILSLSEQSEAFIEVELRYDDGTQLETILSLPLPECPADLVPAESSKP